MTYLVDVTTGDIEGGGEAEGQTSTDGTNVLVTIRNKGNNSEQFSLEGRFAHEFEHARQFEDGEFHFVRTGDGQWVPDRNTYDIFDEVKSFAAQLNVSPASRDTTMLKLLRDSRRSDSDRARILENSYPDRSPVSRDVTNLWNAPKGSLVRPTGAHPNVFGRVHN